MRLVRHGLLDLQRCVFLQAGRHVNIGALRHVTSFQVSRGHAEVLRSLIGCIAALVVDLALTAPVGASCCNQVGGVVLGEVHSATARFPLHLSSDGKEHVTWLTISASPVAFYWLEPEINAEMCDPDERAKYSAIPIELTIHSASNLKDVATEAEALMESKCQTDPPRGPGPYRSCDLGWGVVNGLCNCRLPSLPRAEHIRGVMLPGDLNASARTHSLVNLLNYALNAFVQFEGTVPKSYGDLVGRGYIPFDIAATQGLTVALHLLPRGNLELQIEPAIGHETYYRYDAVFESSKLALRAFVNQPKGAGAMTNRDYYKMRVAAMSVGWFSLAEGRDPKDLPELESFYGSRAPQFWNGLGLSIGPVDAHSGISGLRLTDGHKSYSTLWLAPMGEYFDGGF